MSSIETVKGMKRRTAKKKRCPFILMLYIFFIVYTACGSADKGDETGRIVETNQAKEYYFEMSENGIKELVRKVETINIGDTYDKVLQTLGKPFKERKMRGKEFNAEVKYIELFYYIKKYEKDWSNSDRDIYLRFLLGTDKIVKKISFFPEGWPDRERPHPG